MQESDTKKSLEDSVWNSIKKEYSSNSNLYLGLMSTINGTIWFSLGLTQRQPLDLIASGLWYTSAGMYISAYRKNMKQK